MSMANAIIVALYAGSLRLKYPISFPSNFTFYKWCVTKIAHCIDKELCKIYSTKKVKEISENNAT